MPFKTMTDGLNVKFIPGTKTCKLNADLIYQIPDDFPRHSERGLDVIAHKGFISDLASIPQAAQVAISKVGLHRKAAVIHDRLYCTGFYKKNVADLIFLYAMKEDRVGFVKRRLMYGAVKYGGYFAWRGHRKREEA